MCEANVYLKVGNEEKLFLEAVDKVTPVDGELIMENIFGQKRMIKGKILEMALVEHKIVIGEEEN